MDSLLQEPLHRSALLAVYATQLLESMLRGEEPDRETVADWLVRLEDAGVEVEACRRELAKLS